MLSWGAAVVCCREPPPLLLSPPVAALQSCRLWTLASLVVLLPLQRATTQHLPAEFQCRETVAGVRECRAATGSQSRSPCRSRRRGAYHPPPWYNILKLKQRMNNCSDRSMEVQIPALSGILTDRPTDRSIKRPTVGQTE